MIRMSKRRTSFEIYSDILKVAKEGTKKSHIVYWANLNFKIVEEYLTHLQKSGLISYPTNKEPFFRTTARGLKYLDEYARLTGNLMAIESA